MASVQNSLFPDIPHDLVKGLSEQDVEKWLKKGADQHLLLAVIDNEGRIIYATEHYCEAFGYTLDELVGKNACDTYAEILSEDEETVKEIVDNGKIWKGTVCGRTKSGRLHWGENTVIPLSNASGEKLGTLLFRTNITRLQDIEKEKTALSNKYAEKEASLQKSQNQFQVFFENAPIGLSWRIMNPDGTQKENYANKRFTELTGLSVEELENLDNVVRVTPPEDWKKQKELQRRLYAGERDSFTLEKRYIHKDGRVVWTMLKVVVLRDGKGVVTNHLAMLEDITARHAAEQRLKSTESRWRTYLQTATEILYALTPDKKIKYITPSVYKKLGYTAEELTGTEILSLIHPDDVQMLDNLITVVLKEPHFQQQQNPIEYRIRCKSGEWSWHASTGTSYFDRNGERAFFGVAHDINMRRKAEEELKVALERREELERIINRSPSVVVLWKAGPEWPAEYVSESVKQFGYEPEQFTSCEKTFRGITHPDDRERVADEVYAHAVNKDLEYNQEYRIVCADDSVRWVDDHTVVRVDEQGRVTHHEGLITDITARKEAEDRVKTMQEQSLDQAAAVQRHLSPHEFPDISAVEVEAFSQPCTHIGGDYYDVLKVGPSHWGFVIADVAGKGPGAALIMAACRATLRLCAMDELSPTKTITRVNRVIFDDMPKGMFISLFYGVLDLETNKLRYVRAGHEPALLLRRGASDAELLDPSGLALGFDKGPLFESMLEERETDLRKGDLLALYTDGVTEATNSKGEEFGRDRFIGTLSKHSNGTLEEAVHNLERHLSQYSTLATRADDRTLLLVRPR